MKEKYENSNVLRQDILDIVSKCVKCRFCFSQCPVFEVSDGWVTQGGSGITQSLYYAIKFNKINEYLRDILMRCTTCSSCEIICERIMAGVSLVDAISKGRKLLFEEEVAPIIEQQKALESLETVGNPYGKPLSKRTAWADNLDIKKLNDSSEISTLYYVGCTPSYDDRIQLIAKSICGILREANVEFGILENEKCSGDPALIMGEQGLFEVLSEENLERFKKCGVQTILTTSPHDFNCFLNEYPEDIKKINVKHYTQLILDLVDQGRISFKKTFNKKVTYQDPCYLGKHNNIYEAPRKLLNSIPGLELVEMKRNRENSLCCGGGGGRMWADFDEAVHLGEIRVKEALDTGAEILVTACPFCLINFEDAIKVLNKEDDITVKDVSEIIFENMDY